MEKNHLIDGRNIFPNNLKIKKKINIGIVGSGKIAIEYIKIIKSFGHNICVIVSPSRNSNLKNISKKFAIQTSFSFKNSYKKFDNIDAWVICTKWNDLKKYLYFFLNEKKPVLIEKSIIINSSELNKICLNKNYDISNIIIAYNRNYYEYIGNLTKKLKKNKLNFIEANIYDPYSKITENKGKKIIPYLPYYISSHWVGLILKIFQLSNIKILKIKKDIIKKSASGNLITLNFLLKQKKNTFFLRYNHFPDMSQNHSIKFFFKNEINELSPIEIFKKHLKLKLIKNKKSNYYKTETKTFSVNSNFKPGFRYLYYDFINHTILKKKSKIITDLKALSNIYKICELLISK